MPFYLTEYFAVSKKATFWDGTKTTTVDYSGGVADGTNPWPPLRGSVYATLPMPNAPLVIPPTVEPSPGGGGSGAPVPVPFSAVPILTNLVSISMSTVSAPIAFTPPSNGVAGSSAYTRLVADGVLANTPTFAGFKQLLGSSGWDNRAGISNLIQWLYDGVDYFYSITQSIGAIAVDTIAPTLVSSLLNGAKNKITLTYSEPILGAITPAQYTATGMTITAAAIVGNAVELTLSPAVVGGAAITLAYIGNTIKDGANNLAATFVAQSILNPVGSVFFAIRAATLTEASDVYTGSVAGAWGNVGVTATANFLGAKTLSAKIGGVDNAMLWIDATGDIADYTSADYGIFRNGLVAYRTIINGALAVIPTIVPLADSEVRLVRNAVNNLKAEFSNDAGSTWTFLWDFGTIAATPFFCKMASNTAPVSKVALI